MPPRSLPSLQELYSCRPAFLWRYFKAEHISFWLVCAYLIFEYVRPAEIYPWMRLIPFSTLTLAGAYVTSFFDKEQKPKSNAVSKLIVCYSIVVFLSAVFAYYPSEAFSNLMFFYMWVIVYFSIVRVVHTRKRFFIFLIIYFLCNIKMSQHGFRTWVSRGFNFDVDGVYGAPGWFQNSGEFGIELCIFVPMFIAFILALRSYWGALLRLMAYSVPVFSVGAALATSSRGAIVGLVMSGVWGVKSTKYFVRAMLAVLVVGTLAYQLTPPEFKARFQSAGTDRTSLHRMDRWKQGWNLMLDRPLLGVGFYNWDRYFAEHLDTITVPGTPKVHNMFIESGTEEGFLGLATLIGILLAMFSLNRKTRQHAELNNDNFSYCMAHGMDAAILGLVASASFVTVLYYPYVWIHAAFVSALYNSNLKPMDG